MGQRRMFDENDRGSVFSLSGHHRYLLYRRWSSASKVGFVGVNPSTAGKSDDHWWDLTARKFEGFAVRNAFGGWYAGNLFGLVSTDPAALHTADDDPVGESDKYLRLITERCRTVVVCWGGPGGAFKERVAAVEKLLGEEVAARGGRLMCLGKTQGGDPRHPSRLPYATRIEPYEVRRVERDAGGSQ